MSTIEQDFFFLFIYLFLGERRSIWKETEKKLLKYINLQPNEKPTQADYVHSKTNQPGQIIFIIVDKLTCWFAKSVRFFGVWSTLFERQGQYCKERLSFQTIKLPFKKFLKFLSRQPNLSTPFNQLVASKDCKLSN